MKIAILCAMQEELTSIIQILGRQIICNKSKQFEHYVTCYENHELRLVLCGVGKVNAALHTQYIIDTFAPDYIINVGVAGSLSPKLNFGDIVVASDLIQYDMDITPLGLELGQIPFMKDYIFECDKQLVKYVEQSRFESREIYCGRIVSGDRFVDDAKYAHFIRDHFGALACDMEGAAVAQVCHINQKPFLIVRAISDMAGRGGINAAYTFRQMKDMAAACSSIIIKQVLTCMANK